jgi:hypothetical protein
VASANLDLVCSIYAAWERCDYSSAEWAHPEIENVSADGPAPGGSTGLAGMAVVFRGWLSTWEERRVEAEEYRDLHDGPVLVFFHMKIGRPLRALLAAAEPASALMRRRSKAGLP